MKEVIKTLIEKMNQSEEISKEQIIELVSCFKDADPLRDESFILEAEQALAGVFTNERIKRFDQSFISSRMAELLSVAGTVQSYENLGIYQIEDEEKHRCVLQAICLGLDDGSEVHVVSAREEQV